MIENIGWLLVHSIWQFTLWALVALLLQRCLRRASATVRYNNFVSILLLMTLTPLFTWGFLPDAPLDVVEQDVTIGPLVTDDIPPADDPLFEPEPFHDPERLPNLITEIEWEDSTRETGRTTIDHGTDHASSHADEPAEVTTWSHTIQQVLMPWLDGIVGLWFAGVLLFSLRPLGGWYTMKRLSTKKLSAVPDDLRNLLRETAERLGVTKSIRLFQSTLVTVPLVTGLLRPIILLPASVVTGLPPAQLQAILAHELAHIHRYDPFVNLWQTLVETIFFYHPLVWWLSHRIRCERENCCDDLAASVSGGQLEYSRALLAVEELRGTNPALVLSSHGGSLSSRIKRLMIGEPKENRSGFLAIVAVLILLIGLTASYLWWNADDQTVARLEAENAVHEDPPMSAEEQAAWDALCELEGIFGTEITHRQHMKGHLSTLERFSFPEETLETQRHELNRPVEFADFKHVPDEAWSHIVKLHSLRSLSITGTDVRGRPMEFISQLKNLRRLNIAFGECVPSDLVSLKDMPELEHVEIVMTDLGKSKEEWIQQRGELTAAEKEILAELMLPKPPANRRWDRDLIVTALHTDRAIRELSGLKKLRSFKLVNTFVTDASFEALSELPALEILQLSVIGFPGESPHSIGEISTLRSFSQSHADNETLQELSPLSNLEQLDVWADGVTSEGVPHLLKLKNLRRLEMRGNRLDDAGLIQLAQLPKLKHLDIKHSDGDLTLAGVLAFQEKKPDCRLEVDDNLPLVAEEETQPEGEQSESTESPAVEQPNIPILERNVSLSANKIPLRDALRNIAKQANVELELDAEALEEAELNVFQEVEARFEDLPLHEALGELIDWPAYPGVFRKIRGGKLLLTTLAAQREQVRQHIPDWLKPLLGNGMLAHLDENDEVAELYFGDAITDELLANLKTLPRLRMLNIEVTTQLTSVGLAHLAELVNLETLQVYTINKDEALGDHILRHITGLKGLRELSIGQCGVTDEGLKRLEQMPQLTSLRLNNEGLLTDDCLSSIAKLKNLKTLSMSSYVATAQHGWMRFSSEALAQLSALRNLEELHLTGQPFPANSFTFTKLKSLDVSGDQVDDEFVKRLTQCPNLRRLNLWRTNVTDAGLWEIAVLPELRKLSLFNTPITDEGLRALTSSTKLEHLELRNLKISDTGIGYVGKTNTLTRLDLYACTRTTADGLEQLKSLPKLHTLYLTNFPDKTGYRGLSQLKQLRELSFMACGILYEDWEWLKTEMPRTQIHHMTGGGGFSMWKPEVPKTKVELPKLPQDLQPEEDPVE